MPVYVSDVRDLFHQETEKEYHDRLEELQLKWSEAFLYYYMNELNEKVTSLINSICFGSKNSQLITYMYAL